MNHFLSVKDVDQVDNWLTEALSIKENPFQYAELGKNKTLGLIFFNSSLRTRMSSQRAAYNLGMNVIVMNVGTDSWKLEFEDGSVMAGDKAEHVREGAAVMGQYCDILGVRAFAGLTDREKDYQEEVLTAFQAYAGVPIISLESATRHPLQSFADLITIESTRKKARPKVVLSWAPHPRALPQAVANSFAEWMLEAEVDLSITHPKGYELDPEFVKDTPVIYDQEEAFEGADFVYVKNWSSYKRYGQVLNTEVTWQVRESLFTENSQCYVMHCLPVRRNVVLADDILNGPRSLVIEQAANRVVSAQTVLKQMLTT
ncbi:MAG: acetylornithine carbamoyltransferase [Bacteroidota bacterium]